MNARWGLWGLAWFGAIYGSLQLHRLELGHSICGPWGCGPPTGAILAMHSFWLATVIPVGLLCTRLKPNWNWRRIGLGLLIASMVGIFGVGIQDYFAWQPNPAQPVYVIQRFLFRLAILTERPVVQVGLLGALMMVAVNRNISQSPFADAGEK